MKTSILIFTSLAALASLHAEGIGHPPINPALLYWQSAAQLPNLSNDRATALHEIASGKKSITAVSWQDFGFDGAEKLLLKAAGSTAPCDWGLPWELGPETPMPHFSKLIELANIAIGEAEFQFTQGHVDQGQKWLITAHRVARHAGADDLLISCLVQYAIEQNALRGAARHCLAWDDQVRHTYRQELQQLPPLHSLQQAYQGEYKLNSWLEHLLTANDAERKAATQTLCASADATKDRPGDTAIKQSEIQALEAPDKLRKAIAELREYQQKTYAILGKPWKTAAKELADAANDAKHSESVLVRMILPTVTAIHNKAGAMATMQTMLNAGLQYGPQLDADHAGEFHDAFEGSPLQLKKESDSSMTLQAATTAPGGKITELRFGK